MKKLILLTFFAVLALVSTSQTLMPLPPHSSVYPGQARGYWFIAPVDFTIVGLRVPSQAGTGAQYIQVMELLSWNPASPPTFTAQTSNFNTLIYINGAANGVIQNVNIPIKQNQIIGILGIAGTDNSYATGPFSTTVNGASMTIQRFGYQLNINTGPAPLCWGVAQNASGSISRVELYWEPTITKDNDAGVSKLIQPASGCEGPQDVYVEIQNFGTNQISSLEVKWSFDGLSKTSYLYTGTLDTANGTGQNKDTVLLGSVNFLPNTSHDISAWTFKPNNKVDSVSYNDSTIQSLYSFKYPTLTLGPDKTICPFEPITLDAGLGRDSIIWSTTETTQTISVGNAGQYSASVFENGCETKDTVNISLYPAPPKINFGPDTTICFNDSLLLDATTAGMTYLWSNSSTQPTQYITQSGSYWVQIEDGNMCHNGDTILVGFYIEPSVQIYVAPSNELCNGVEYTFTAFPVTQGSIDYQWKVNGANSGPQTTSNSFKGPVNYGDSVSVDLITDICSVDPYPVPSNKIEMIINPAPKTINGASPVIENSKEVYAVTLSPTSAYVWRVKGGTIQGDSTKNIVTVNWGGPDPNGSVTLVETDSKNCTRENLKPVPVVSIVGVNNNNSAIGIGKAYPNPSSNLITVPIISKEIQDVQIALYDLTGKVVSNIYNGDIHNSQNIQFDVSKLKNGLYFLKFTTEEGFESTQKITVHH